ncbi:hypothetical protein ACF3MZ_04950 [Paenibacillaceae bacterium WGS1546]|uniref:hypothetical protein n=1 Tax=Cohnella sp. WGS1546 TaxID=3366810 RepID=UPI00372CE894
MVKSNILIFGSLTLATILGIFGQGITYFINDTFVEIDLISCLTILTVTSILLYLAAVLFAYIAGKKKMIDKNKIRRYFPIIGSIGTLTSLWSVFVLAMWWG